MPPHRPFDVIALVAGLLGAGGVSLAAMAAHRVEEPALATAAHFLIMHAAAALALAAIARKQKHPRAWIWATGLMLAGVTLFSGDIAARTLLGHALFPMAAPLGGSTLIASWLGVAFAGVKAWRTPAD